MNKDKALHYVNHHNLIWMVTINDRIFVRSWGLAEKSWYNTFLQDPKGQIRCGEEVFHIKARIPDDLIDLTSDINTAYLTKYNTGSNLKYSKGIIQQKHVEKTMEFIICE